MSAVTIASLGWGVVQDESGNVMPGVGYSLTLLDDTPVAAGSTNSRGEIPGTIAIGVYKLTILGRTIIVHADPEDPFILGSVSLAEVKIAVDNGWEEVRAKSYTREQLLEMHEDPNHPLELDEAMLRGTEHYDEVAQLKKRIEALEAKLEGK